MGAESAPEKANALVSHTLLWPSLMDILVLQDRLSACINTNHTLDVVLKN